MANVFIGDGVPTLSTEPETGLRDATGELRLHNVCKRFYVNKRDVNALNNIDLTIRPGEFVSIVGPSGCGKSTLLRLLAGLERPTSGTITLDGRALDGPGLDRGIVFQDHRLLPWLTVEGNIALAFEATRVPREERRRRVAAQIELVGLQGFEKAHPHQLSGGMAQRAAIARALVNKPEILLLDEPLSALDAFTRAHIQRELQRIWLHEGITMVLVTHDIEEAVYLGDRVVVLESHPGAIRKTVLIDLEHPRDREDERFARFHRSILHEFQLGMA